MVRRHRRVVHRQRRSVRSRHVRGVNPFKYGLIFAVCLVAVLMVGYFGSSVSGVVPINPTPTPMPIPANNLISVTDGQWFTDSLWNKAPADGILLSSSVTHNGNPSWFIPLNPSDSNGVDHCLNLHPGDHIVFSCWIKTSGATLSADYNNPQAGGRIGIDFYGSQGGIAGTAAPDGTTSSDSNPWGSVTDSFNTYVPFGTYGHDWTQVTMDFVVPSQIQYLYGSTGLTGHYSTGHYSTGQLVTPTAAVIWLQVWSDTQGTNEHGNAWFADPVFTVTPP